jgi:hypothetical protein
MGEKIPSVWEFSGMFSALVIERKVKNDEQQSEAKYRTHNS